LGDHLLDRSGGRHHPQEGNAQNEGRERETHLLQFEPWIRRHLGTVFRELAQRKECKIEEGHLMPDHVHMLISIPPKYSVAEVIGYLKGKSSIWIAQNVERKLRNFLGHKFWARGYFVSTVGRDEETIRAYIKNQEIADKQLDQLQLKLVSS
jgi:putative transposase